MTVVPESHEIIAALRQGLVPGKGLDHFATGLEPLAKAVLADLALVADGNGGSKWIRGEYGSGKTLAGRYLCKAARAAGFATAEVQVSINDTPLHHLETVYRRLVEKLETDDQGANAFQAVVDQWLYQLGDQVQRLKGITDSDPSFADETEQRLEDQLADLSRRNATFARVLRAYHRAQHESDFATGQGLLAWLGGQPNVHRSVMAKAGVSGKIDGQAALTFLAGVLKLLRHSGYKGLVVVLDEVETIQRMNAQVRVKALIALRQFMDAMASGELPGLYLIVTGTRDFFEGYKGLRTEGALFQRVNVEFDADPTFDNLRATQVRLKLFDKDRLIAVGKRIRDLFPAEHPERVTAKVTDAFLERLADQLTQAFRGTVSVLPRQYLRKLTDVLDRVDQHETYDPSVHYKLTISEDELSASELAAMRGEIEPVAEEVAAEPAADAEAAGVKGRRLDG